MNNFYVGQKVVCVYNKNLRFPGKTDAQLLENKIYTIRYVGTSKMGIPIVHVEEIYHTITCRGKEVAFRADRFRPLEERKTDIGWAHKLVEPYNRHKIKTRQPVKIAANDD